jgi:hypothetical protein
MAGATIVAVGFGVAIAVASGPLYRLCTDIGAELLDPSAYIRAVTG